MEFALELEVVATCLHVSADLTYVSLVMRSTLTHVSSLSSLYTTSRLQSTKGFVHEHEHEHVHKHEHEHEYECTK